MKFGKGWHLFERYTATSIGQPASDDDGIVGEQFFAELKDIFDVTEFVPVDGIVPDLEVLRSADFDPDLVDAQVRNLYEKTSGFGFLAERINWTPQGLLAHQVWRLVGGPMKQLVIPMQTAMLPTGIDSDIQAPRRRGAPFRGWLRRFRSTQDVLYGAVVTVIQRPQSTNQLVPRAYLVFTLPLWRSNFTIVFRPSNHRGGGLRLSTNVPGDPLAGAYFVVPSAKRYSMTPAFTIDDEIRVWPTRSEAGAPMLRAVHRSRLFGARSFELEYELRPRRMVA